MYRRKSLCENSKISTISIAASSRIVDHRITIINQINDALQPNDASNTLIEKTASIAMSCRPETQTYRKCLKDAHSSGGSSKSCQRVAQTLEVCRVKYRKQNNIQLEFDGRRILPNKKCQPLNDQVQSCMKWKKSDESKCQDPIRALKKCMDSEEGIVATPTEGDKIWSDYKGKR